jgi:hypothetical protein
VLEASQGVPVLTQFIVVRVDVVADNWDDLFDGGDDSNEQHREPQPIVTNNWGGLFEQLAHITEELVTTNTTKLQQRMCGHAFSSHNDILDVVPVDTLVPPPVSFTSTPPLSKSSCPRLHTTSSEPLHLLLRVT